MEVGDLVYKVSKWVEANSWMEDTELDSTDKAKLGIIVKMSTNEWLVEVAWSGGSAARRCRTTQRATSRATSSDRER